MTIEYKPYSPHILFDEKYVYKTRLRFKPEDILSHYEELASAGIPLGKPPEYIERNGKIIEVDTKISGVNGAEFLQTASEDGALWFFDSVILESIRKIQKAHGGSLSFNWSMDLVPHNFVGDRTNGFKYVDYEPSFKDGIHTHFLEYKSLLNYAVVKFTRERPEFLEQISDEMPELSDRPYIKFLKGQISQKAAWDETNTKDNWLGLLIVLVLKADDEKIKKLGGSRKKLIHFAAYKIAKYSTPKLKEFLLVSGLAN